MTPLLQDLAVIPEGPKLARYRSLVGQTAMFRGLPPTAIDGLVRRFRERTCRAGSILSGHDDPGEAMFLIVHGRAKVVLFGGNRRELTLSELAAGDVFGAMELLDGSTRSADVVALDDTKVLALARDAFVAHLTAYPQIALNLLRELTGRLRRADETIAILALDDVESRLTLTLERLAREQGERIEGGLLLDPRPTHKELAGMIGSRRETISRTFTSMIERGLLVPHGRALLLTRKLLARREPAAPM